MNDLSKQINQAVHDLAAKKFRELKADKDRRKNERPS